MKIRCLTIGIMGVLHALTPVQAEVAIDFTNNDPAAFFVDEEDAQASITAKAGEALLPETLRSVASEVLAVEPLTKYRLDVVARLEGGEVVEDNPRLPLLLSHRFGGKVASLYRVVFLDQNGEVLQLPGSPPQQGSILTRASTQYTSVFYTPADTHGVRIEFLPNQHRTYLKGVKLAKEREEGALNPNPDFRYGTLNYSGWRPMRDGELLTRPDGKTILKTGYGGTSPVTPVVAGKEYQVTVTGTGGGMSINYVNAEGKTFSSRAMMTLQGKPLSVEFVPPSETVAIFFAFHGSPGVLLESVLVKAL